MAPKPEKKRAPIAAPERSDSWRTLGFVSAGVGVAAVGVGGFFGLRAISKAHDADAACSSTACTDPNAVDLERDAGRAADISTISFVVGGAALAFAGYALFIHPSSSRPAPSRAGFARPASLGIRW